MKNSICVLFLCLLVSAQAFSQDSVYVYLKSKPVSKFAIVDIDSIKFEKPIQYSYYVSKSSTSAFVHYSTAIPSINALYDYSVVYDGSTPINLNDLVWATAINGSIEKKFADYGLGTAGVNYQFVFSSSFAYYGLDGLTNHNSFIQIQSDGKIAIVGGTSAIDRTPVVKVELKNMAGVLLAQAYIKFKIVSSITPPPVNPTPVSYNVSGVTYNYSSLFRDAISGVSAGDVTDIYITWVAMNSIYSSLGMSHNDFQSVYGALTPTVAVKVNNITVNNATLAQYPLMRSMLAPNVDTYSMKCQVTPLAKFGTTNLTYKFTPANTSYPILNVTFTYTIEKPILDKSILSPYQYINSFTTLTQGNNTSFGGWKMQLYLGEAFGFGSSSLKDMFGVGSNNKIDGATHQFIVIDNYVKASVPSYILSNATSASISGLLGSAAGTGCLMEMNPMNPLDLAERTYTVNFRTIYPNAESDDFNYSVIFRTPLTVELETTADFDLLDNKTGAKDQIDLTKNYVVKMLGDVVFNKTGVSTANAAVYGLGTSTRTYAATNVIPSFAYAFSFSSPVLTWENPGSRLVSTQKICDAVFTYTAPFAKVSMTTSVNVIPDYSYGIIKRK